MASAIYVKNNQTLSNVLFSKQSFEFAAFFQIVFLAAS